MDLGWPKFCSSFRDILELAFVERVLLDVLAHLNTRKEHQATQELWEAPVSLGAWEVSLYGGGAGSFSLLPVLNTICLVGSLLRHKKILYLKQNSFISVSQKKIWT